MIPMDFNRTFKHTVKLGKSMKVSIPKSLHKYVKHGDLIELSIKVLHEEPTNDESKPK